jgi:hypothetical protein
VKESTPFSNGPPSFYIGSIDARRSRPSKEVQNDRGQNDECSLHDFALDHFAFRTSRSALSHAHFRTQRAWFLFRFPVDDESLLNELDCVDNDVPVGPVVTDNDFHGILIEIKRPERREQTIDAWLLPLIKTDGPFARRGLHSDGSIAGPVAVCGIGQPYLIPSTCWQPGSAT